MRSLLVLILLASTAHATPTDDLVARLLGPTPILDDLRELTDTIGGRPTGSPALDKAIDWAQERLRAAGVETVRAESYVPPRNWVPRSESVEIIAPEHGALRAAAMPFSPAATNAEAEVFDLTGDLATLTAKAKGKWVLVHSEPMKGLEDLFKEYMMTPPLFAAAKKAGAAGVLWISNRPGRLLYRHNIALDGSLGVLPGVVIEHEGGERIARYIAAGKPVRVRVTIAADVQDKPTDRNVVAEIKGKDKPDEIVILGAHLDSWDLGRGALDNGCNAALVIDVARQLAALAKAGIRPRRTVRFMLYTGEELGTYGSWFDVRNHRAELDKLTAMVVFDIGTGRTTGFSLGGRPELADAVTRALAPVAGLGPFVQTPDAFIGTDNYDYLLEGVPNLTANQDGAPYLADYHAESDTFDKVDQRELKANATIAGVLVWNLADAPQRLGTRQSRKDILPMLKKTGLEDQMKIFGLWDDFAAGKRGR
jgi:Iap family predicted aminopeptidase